jgi:hypothetical protein
MKFRNFLIRISLILIVLVSAYWLSFSCGWTEDECDSYTSFISPALSDVKNSSHFYYSPNMFFNACYETPPNDDSLLLAHNARDWQSYFGATISQNDINEFISKSSLDTLTKFYNHIEKQSAFSSTKVFSQNALTLWFKQNKDLEALGYLLFAKKCEKVSAISMDSWELPARDTLNCKKMMKNGIQLYNAAKSDFIKKRYALQLIKTAFYGGFYNELLSYYTTYYLPLKKEYTIVDRRIDGYKAGAIYKMGRKLESAYLFSRLFDESNDAVTAYSNSLGFVWSLKADSVEYIAALGKSNHEKAMIYALAGMRDAETYSQTWIEKVYDLEPDNKYLDILVTRELNKLEKEYLEMRYQMDRGYLIYDAYFGGVNMKVSNYERDEWNVVQKKAETNLGKFASMFDRLAKDNRSKRKSIWYLASAYLDFIQGNFSSCDQKLKQARVGSPTDKVSDQIRVVELLNRIGSLNQFDSKTEGEIANELAWLESKSKTNADYYRIFRNLLKTELPKKFGQLKDTLRMTLCYHRYENAQENYYQSMNPEYESSATLHFSDLYSSISGGIVDYFFTQTTLDQMLNYMQNANSPFDKWLIKDSRYTPDVLREVKAVKYFRDLDYKSARQIIAKNKVQEIVPNLFVSHPLDLQDGYHADTLNSFTTSQVLDTLLALQTKKLVDLRCAFDYGCALYSLSYHGKCHQAWNFHRDATAIDPYFRDTLFQNYSQFDKQFYFAEEAREAFQFVLSQKPNTEIKSKAIWMLAKCEQKRCNLKKPEYLGWSSNEDQDSKDYVSWNLNRNSYLALFYKECKGMPFYDEVYQECSYLKLYASKRK